MNIKAIAEKIGMDYEAVMEDYCGDVSALKDKLIAFPSSADLTALEQSISERNADGMKKEAHKIRKCAEKLGLHEIAKLASRIEEVNHEKAVSDFAELKTARDAVCSIIENAV